MNFVQPAARGFWGGLLGFDVFLTLVLIGVVLIIFKRRYERVIAVILAMPAVIARWATYGLSGHDHLVASAIHHGSIAVFFGFAIFVILRGVFDDKVVKTDHFIGTVCGYLLAGAAWGSCYMLADLVADNAFSIKTELNWQLRDDDFRSFLFNYFSLCTLTGASYGDITPTATGAATFTWLEAAFGQFYIAVVVAQLVSVKVARITTSRVAPQNVE